METLPSMSFAFVICQSHCQSHIFMMMTNLKVLMTAMSRACYVELHPMPSLLARQGIERSERRLLLIVQSVASWQTPWSGQEMCKVPRRHVYPILTYLNCYTSGMWSMFFLLSMSCFFHCTSINTWGVGLPGRWFFSREFVQTWNKTHRKTHGTVIRPRHIPKKHVFCSEYCQTIWFLMTYLSS